MRRFYTHPGKSQDIEYAALVASLAAAGVALFEIYSFDDESHWISLAVPTAVAVVALYTFVRIRWVARRPVLEITDTNLRWRKPGHALFSSIQLDDLVSMHFAESKLQLITRTGGLYSIALQDLHLREGSFAIGILRSDLEGLLGTRAESRGPGRNQLRGSDGGSYDGREG